MSPVRAVKREARRMTGFSALEYMAGRTGREKKRSARRPAPRGPIGLAAVGDNNTVVAIGITGHFVTRTDHRARDLVGQSAEREGADADREREADAVLGQREATLVPDKALEEGFHVNTPELMPLRAVLISPTPRTDARVPPTPRNTTRLRHRRSGPHRPDR